MLPIFLIAFQEPRDLTPLKSYARELIGSVLNIAQANGYGDLRKHMLPKGDAEIRYWGGFAWGTSGIVFKCHAGQWTAMGLTEIRNSHPVRLGTPKSGWASFWKKAEALGIWSMPDQSEKYDVPGYQPILDGYSTLVETRRNGVYRSYAYDNPEHQPDWPPAKPMSALVQLIRSEFPRSSRR